MNIEETIRIPITPLSATGNGNASNMKEMTGAGNPTNLNDCRMYENKYPEVDDLIMVKVRQIAEMGAYVQLLEYSSIEGMILLSELSRRRIRSIQKLIRVGRDEVVVVLRVDREKGYIDLSKRRVGAEDIVKCEERYRKSVQVHSIMRHVAEKRGVRTEDLYIQFGWPLYKKYGHAYDAFKLALTDGDSAEIFEGLEVPEVTKREVLSIVKKRLTPQAVKIRADVEVTCFAYAGIDAIKSALRAGLACATLPSGGAPPTPPATGTAAQPSSAPVVGADITIKLVAPPHYVLITNCTDKVLGIQTLEKAISAIDASIKANGGACTVRVKPRSVGVEDEELSALLERVERENADVSGDDDSEFSD